MAPDTLEFSDLYVEGTPEAVRLVAIYALPKLVTRYKHEFQPDGTRERQTVA